jgi:hypothetical protein
MLNDIGSTAANPGMSNFTREVLTNVFQQSNLNQSDEDELEETEQNYDLFVLILIQIAGKTMMKN